jgi:hypothetical protein
LSNPTRCGSDLEHATTVANSDRTPQPFYLATSVARDSRTTVTRIWPG